MTSGDQKIKNPNGRCVKDGGCDEEGRNGIDNGENRQSQIVDVLILGAGLAGLGAATKLKDSGLTFLILEAQHKAGGRVNTVKMLPFDQNQSVEKQNDDDDDENVFIDCGAQWLHGKYNYLHELAERRRLLIAEQSEEGLGIYVRDDGHQFDSYFVRKIDFKVGQILEECELYARDNLSNYPQSVNQFLRERFEQFLDSILDRDERVLAEQLLDWHIRFQIIDNSCLSLADVSAKSWGKYSYNGESCQAHYNFRMGFSSAVDALIGELNNEFSILFKKEVIEIECNRMQLHTDHEPRAISVKCKSSTANMADTDVIHRYYANHVLVTFSLGCVKNQIDSNVFRPKLPKRMEQTIRDIGFETINKLFIQFETEWWGQDVDGIQLIFQDQDYTNGHWTRHISGFDVMKPGPSNTLLAWVGGMGAIEMEQLSDKEIIDDCIELLTKFTKIAVPSPIRYYCTRWHTNRFINGAYSYISTDCDRNGTSSHMLAEPITFKDWRSSATTSSSIDNDDHDDDDDDNVDRNFAHNVIKIKQLQLSDDLEEFTSDTTKQLDLNQMPVLLFAGEACHERYFSTAHGAFMSGIEQAEKILAFYKATTIPFCIKKV